MNNDRQSIPINRIDALRLTCNLCQAALIIPVDAREIPGRCFNCRQELPSSSVQKLITELRYMKQELNQTPIRHAISIEAISV